MTMIETAEIVAKRYGISRERQDEYALQIAAPHRRRAAGAASSTTRSRRSPPRWWSPTRRPATSRQGGHAVARTKAPRPDTTAEGLPALKPVRRTKASDVHHRRQCLAALRRRLGLRAHGATSEAARRGLQPLGIYRGIAVAGCEPDEMGIGPVFAVPQAAEAPRPEGRRHRPVGAERGLRGAGALLPRPARHRPATSSTSTAARSRSAIPTACRARG